MQLSSDIIGYRLRATDGAIGTIDDLLFDDTHFGLRWIVVDTGTWLTGRKVLLPPSALGAPDPKAREYPVDLERYQIKAAPGPDTDKPVSRQLENDIYGHYGWTPYWYGGLGLAAAGGVPAGGKIPEATTPDTQDPKGDQDRQVGDPHLRSTNEVTGYYVEATDDSIGHIEDFILDETDWVIRYLMIDTKNWWPGKMVLISPDWLRSIRWSDKQVFVDVARDRIKGAPEYDPSISIDRNYEKRVYTYYGYRPYWTG